MRPADANAAAATAQAPRRVNFAKTTSTGEVLEMSSSSGALDLEPHDSRSGATSMLTHSHLESPSIRIDIRRARLLLSTLVLVALIAVLMWFCHGDGVRLETFVSTDKGEPARKQLLDKYNSLSGNAVSVFIKPLEFFVAIALALALLCFATEFALGPHTARYHRVLLVLVAATGYLLTTGFNAINVQLAPRPIDAVVSVQDLSLSATGDVILDIDAPEQKRAKVAADLLNRSLVEEEPSNPITNTVFRNWALALEVNPPTQCYKEESEDKVAKFGGVSALYRIPGRAWYSEALPAALQPSKQLKFVAEYPTMTARVVPNPAGRGDTSKIELPMSRTRAMKLLVDAVHNTDRIFFNEPQWGAFRSALVYTAQTVFRRQFAGTNTSKMSDAEFPTLTDLLLQEARDARGAAFSDADVLQVMANLTLQTFSPESVRGPKVDVELTHFDLSDNLVFDAVTVEFPSHSGFLQQRLVANASARNGYSVASKTASGANSSVGDQYYELDALTNCSLSACALLDSTSKVKPQILAIRACVDDPERDATRFKYLSPFDTGNGNILCTNTSNTSLVVVSVGVRIEGDEISHGSIGSGNRTRQILRLKNARKVYSVTVGRLAWETVDIAALYGATCAGSDPSLCHGVRYTLSHSEGSKRRHVLLSSKRVPLDALSEYYYHFNDVGARYLSLVELPTIDSSILSMEDMVLPRRFKRSSLPRASDAKSTACSANIEDFVFHMEMNHLYIEKSLQPAYVAAIFFLFQDGVVRDEVNDAKPSAAGAGSSGGASQMIDAKLSSSPVTLAFLNNRQLVDVRISSPLLNIVLTLVGCGFLLVLALAVAVASKTSANKLERFADAHNVVEMLVDTTKYPSMLLAKTISGTTEAAREHHTEASKQQVDADAAVEEPLARTFVKRVMLGRQDNADDMKVDVGERETPTVV